MQLAKLALGILGTISAFALAITGWSDSTPHVVFASPGTGGSSGGAINRFTLRFSEAMVPLGDPRGPAPANLECAVPASGRWADPQTYVFEFERSLPGALTCTVNLAPGLTSDRGAFVSGTARFTIDTGGPSVRAVLPAEYGSDIEEDQVFLVGTNTPATPASIASGAYCAVEGIGERIAIDVLPSQTAEKLLADLGDDDWSSRNFLENVGLPRNYTAIDPAKSKNLPAITAVKCRRPLPPGAEVSLVWGKTVASADNRVSGRDQRYDFSVREAFEAKFSCRRVNPQAGCNPVQNASVSLTAPIDIDTARDFRLIFDGGQKVAPKISDEAARNATISDLAFEGPFPFGQKARLELPGSVKDESGRALANAQRFPLEIRFDQPPPLIKFNGSFGILEAKEGGILPVTVRAVEAKVQQAVRSIEGERLRVEASDGEIAKWLRDVDQADESDFRTEKRGKETVEINHTGTKPLLGGAGTGIKLAPPAGGKEFEVVGIPLGKPGFYVVELASPALGNALLGRQATRYVATAALVTNMSVHFKWSREKSLAWVTTLDGAKPVGGANVRVTDQCSGKLLAEGTADKFGRLAINGLPSVETYTGCNAGNDHGLMVSARSGDDFSFTLTDWGDGITPGDFELDFGYSERGEIIHSILDRTLVRQGETVNMKHIVRRPIGNGFAMGAAASGTLVLSHSGSGTSFDLPLVIGSDGTAEGRWDVPKSAPMGDYAMEFKFGERSVYNGQTIRVDEYRLPTMRATVTGPKQAIVRPKEVPLNFFAGFFSGGAAANLPVTIRTAFQSAYAEPDGWDGWTFGGDKVVVGTIALNSDSEVPAEERPDGETLPLTLGGDGTAAASLAVNREINAETDMIVEMDYQDANGETLTARKSFPLLPSRIRLGLKTDGWMMKNDDLRLKFVALDPDGKPVRGRLVKVDVFNRQILTARRRLIGGFYAYDNQMRTTLINAHCSATTDKTGTAGCTLDPGVSGEVMVVATTTDEDGNVARAVQSVWLAGEDEWWFGGDNGDRMDLIPEAKSYKAGEMAKFQVRMPFREATALVTVEREGVLSSFVTEISGKDPVVKVPLPGAYAPDVYVSVMAVRGRVSGWKLWTAKIARDWGLPFLSKDGYEPTALVDLAKPSYRLGMAKVRVGWDGYQLGVTVNTDRKSYGVRETANIEVAVTEPGGKPARSAEIAFAAVDDALLALSPNESWKLLDGMMGDRPVSVLTSTAQTQVVGKRHYGKKAVETGGGGGDDSALTRTDFKPILLWRGRVALDSAGKARIPVTLADALSSYRLVAIANSGSNLFGTGETSIRTAQDLSIYSGIPPLVRSGDVFGASFTLRNGTDKPMSVTATVKVDPAVASGQPLTVEIPAGGSAPVTWNMSVPENVAALNWVVEAKASNSKASDRAAVSQIVIPAVPLEVWDSTLTRVGSGSGFPLIAPLGALPGMGYIDVKLSNTLAPPLEGVRKYMGDYPYGCFEQKTSRLVALADGASWDKLAAEIPAYLDADGLLRYWPDSSLRGSEALTAYVLSITSEARFVIPAEPRARMIEAMKTVINGKLRRDWAWGGNDRLTRLDALAALARNGESTPAMFGQIGLAPADMPTSTLADWLMTIDRTKGANTSLRAEAEAIMRKRIVYEGTRLDLTDTANAPWWMMTSGDEMAIKALLAVLGRPGWSDDDGRMMIGVAMRQSKGHWDTTPANAWGSIAARRFAARYPENAVTGVTTLSLGAQKLTANWPLADAAAPFRLALPAQKTSLNLSQAGGAGPWAFVTVHAAVPLKEAINAGYRIEKEIVAVTQAKSGQWTRGDVAKVRIKVTATAGRNWVVINDPIPPGATIIGGLGGQSQILAGSANGGEGAYPSYTERGNDAWKAYFEWAPEGSFTVEYAMRLNGTGQFKLPPTQVEAMYSPGIRGAIPNAPVSVQMR